MTHQATYEIRAASRLHFGLWAWGEMHTAEYGGVGMMIDQPELVLRLTPASTFCTRGLLADRVEYVAELCRKAWGWDVLPSYQIEATAAPPSHAGYGVGTQLGLAVAQGLAACQGLEPLPVENLALIAGRGARSAIGTHGFARGGLIVDGGKRVDEPMGRLEQRIAVPEEWRMVLATPRELRGKAGVEERTAFAKVPPVPTEMTAKLQAIARNRIVPACLTANFAMFAPAVYEYGYLAGLCFAAVQGGPYSSAKVRHMVATLRGLGAEGVGQSSWGPTVFAAMPDQASAEQLKATLSRKIDCEGVAIYIAKPCNQGATLLEVPSP